MAEVSLSESSEWKTEFERRPLEEKCQEILPGLYLGPLSVAQSKDDLSNLGITHTVSLLRDAKLLEDIPLDSDHIFHIAIRDSISEVESLSSSEDAIGKKKTTLSVRDIFESTAEKVYQLMSASSKKKMMIHSSEDHLMMGMSIAKGDDPSAKGSSSSSSSSTLPSSTATTAFSKVLVHCSSGISRSSSFIIYYLMRYGADHISLLTEEYYNELIKNTEALEGFGELFFEIDLKCAWNIVYSIRPCILPNDGFFKFLLESEQLIYDQKHSKAILLSETEELSSIMETYSPSMDDGDYKAFSLISVTGGKHSFEVCKQALDECDGNADTAAMKLFSL